MIEHATQHLHFEILLAWAKEHNPVRYVKHQPYYNPAQPAHLFICYKRKAKADQKLVTLTCLK